MAQFNKICPICKKIGHSRYYCKNKPIKTISNTSFKKKVTRKPQKASKPLKTIGKKAKAWNLFIPEWKTANPPDFDGYWFCKIGGSALSDGRAEGGYRLNIGHDISRIRDSTKITDLNNTFPICQKHNRLQSSMSLNEFLETNPDLRCGNY